MKNFFMLFLLFLLLLGYGIWNFMKISGLTDEFVGTYICTTEPKTSIAVVLDNTNKFYFYNASSDSYDQGTFKKTLNIRISLKANR